MNTYFIFYEDGGYEIFNEGDALPVSREDIVSWYVVSDEPSISLAQKNELNKKVLTHA